MFRSERTKTKIPTQTRATKWDMLEREPETADYRLQKRLTYGCEMCTPTVAQHRESCWSYRKNKG